MKNVNYINMFGIVNHLILSNIYYFDTLNTFYLSVSNCVYLYLSVSIRIYPYLSVSIRFYPYLSVSIRIYPYLSKYSRPTTQGGVLVTFDEDNFKIYIPF